MKRKSRDYMRLEPNFKNMIHDENFSLESDIVCDCQNDTFKIIHTGIQKNGLFGIVTLKKQNKQLAIEATCTSCGKKITIYNSTLDGLKPKQIPLEEYKPLILKNNEDTFKINVKYNFEPQNYKTDRFGVMQLYIKEKNGKKEICVFEVE